MAGLAREARDLLLHLGAPGRLDGLAALAPAPTSIALVTALSGQAIRAVGPCMTSRLGGNGDVMGMRLLVAAIVRQPAGCALRVNGVVSP